MWLTKKVTVCVLYLVFNCNMVLSETTVLVTGAAGFIGSNFLRYMFNKYEDYRFIVLDSLTYAGNLNNIPDYIRSSDRFEFFYGSVTNSSLVDSLMTRSDFVVHFAAESHVTNSIYEDATFFDTDVNGTRVMMRSLVKHSHKVQRFVHISTSEVYGTAETVPMDESHPLNPRSPYAAAKAGADRLVYAYWCTYDIPAVILRPFNNYGYNQHIEKLIPRFITNALKGKKLKIDGNGLQLRDWVHTEDTSRAIDLVLHRHNFDQIKNQVINIGTGKGISVLEIANKIENYMDLPKGMVRFSVDRPGQVDCHISSTNKAFELLGWQASKSLDVELPKIIEWYTNNYDWWERSSVVADFLSKDAFFISSKV